MEPTPVGSDAATMTIPAVVPRHQIPTTAASTAEEEGATTCSSTAELQEHPVAAAATKVQQLSTSAPLQYPPGLPIPHPAQAAIVGGAAPAPPSAAAAAEPDRGMEVDQGNALAPAVDIQLRPPSSPPKSSKRRPGKRERKRLGQRETAATAAKQGDDQATGAPPAAATSVDTGAAHKPRRPKVRNVAPQDQPDDDHGGGDGDAETAQSAEAEVEAEQEGEGEGEEQEEREEGELEQEGPCVPRRGAMSDERENQRYRLRRADDGFLCTAETCPDFAMTKFEVCLEQFRYDADGSRHVTHRRHLEHASLTELCGLDRSGRPEDLPFFSEVNPRNQRGLREIYEDPHAYHRAQVDAAAQARAQRAAIAAKAKAAHKDRAGASAQPRSAPRRDRSNPLPNLPSPSPPPVAGPGRPRVAQPRRRSFTARGEIPSDLDEWDDETLRRCTNDTLKTELRHLCLAVSGNKDILVKRLLEYRDELADSESESADGSHRDNSEVDSDDHSDPDDGDHGDDNDDEEEQEYAQSSASSRKRSRSSPGDSPSPKRSGSLRSEKGKSKVHFDEPVDENMDVEVETNSNQDEELELQRALEASIYSRAQDEQRRRVCSPDSGGPRPHTPPSTATSQQPFPPPPDESSQPQYRPRSKSSPSPPAPSSAAPSPPPAPSAPSRPNPYVSYIAPAFLGQFKPKLSDFDKLNLVLDCLSDKRRVQALEDPEELGAVIGLVYRYSTEELNDMDVETLNGLFPVEENEQQVVERRRRQEQNRRREPLIADLYGPFPSGDNTSPSPPTPAPSPQLWRPPQGDCLDYDLARGRWVRPAPLVVGAKIPGDGACLLVAIAREYTGKRELQQLEPFVLWLRDAIIRHLRAHRPEDFSPQDLSTVYEKDVYFDQDDSVREDGQVKRQEYKTWSDFCDGHNSRTARRTNLDLHVIAEILNVVVQVVHSDISAGVYITRFLPPVSASSNTPSRAPNTARPEVEASGCITVLSGGAHFTDLVTERNLLDARRLLPSNWVEVPSVNRLTTEEDCQFHLMWGVHENEMRSRTHQMEENQLIDSIGEQTGDDYETFKKRVNKEVLDLRSRHATSAPAAQGPDHEPRQDPSSRAPTGPQSLPRGAPGPSEGSSAAPSAPAPTDSTSDSDPAPSSPMALDAVLPSSVIETDLRAVGREDLPSVAEQEKSPIREESTEQALVDVTPAKSAGVHLGTLEQQDVRTAIIEQGSEQIEQEEEVIKQEHGEGLPIITKEPSSTSSASATPLELRFPSLPALSGSSAQPERRKPPSRRLSIPKRWLSKGERAEADASPVSASPRSTRGRFSTLQGWRGLSSFPRATTDSFASLPSNSVVPHPHPSAAVGTATTLAPPAAPSSTKLSGLRRFWDRFKAK